MEHEYDGIEYHSDGMGRESHAAINVKVYGPISVDEGYEDMAEAAWESCRERFWEDANEQARARGYGGVYSEGRSGGWLVPYHSWYNGPDLNKRRQSSYYPDIDEIGERSRFRAFQREIEVFVQSVPMEVAAEAVFLTEQAVESFA